MKHIQAYVEQNALYRSLIKLPVLLGIFFVYLLLATGGRLNLNILYISLFCSFLYICFTYNLKKVIRKRIRQGWNIQTLVSFSHWKTTIIWYIFILALLIPVIYLLFDHDTWQESFRMALFMWSTVMLLTITKDIESWLIYKYGQ